MLRTNLAKLQGLLWEEQNFSLIHHLARVLASAFNQQFEYYLANHGVLVQYLGYRYICLDHQFCLCIPLALIVLVLSMSNSQPSFFIVSQVSHTLWQSDFSTTYKYKKTPQRIMSSQKTLSQKVANIFTSAEVSREDKRYCIMQ